MWITLTKPAFKAPSRVRSRRLINMTLALANGVWLLVSPLRGQGQETERFKVHVSAEGANADVFRSVASSALRRLGDVELVDFGSARFALSVKSVCTSGDLDCPQYATALTISLLPDAEGIAANMLFAFHDAGEAYPIENDDLPPAMLRYFKRGGLMRTVDDRLGVVARERFRERLEDWVATFDSLCLEYFRQIALLTAETRNSANEIEAFARGSYRLSNERDWMCS